MERTFKAVPLSESVSYLTRNSNSNRQNVAIGHKAILNGCSVEDGCLIETGVVVSRTRIENGSMMAARAEPIHDQTKENHNTHSQRCNKEHAKEAFERIEANLKTERICVIRRTGLYIMHGTSIFRHKLKCFAK